jgi:CBS domain-containing protein
MATVREIMHAELVTAPENATVAEAATIMGERHVGSTLVMEDDQLIGIFTERDIVRALSQDFDAPGQQISHWMTREPQTISPDASVDEAMTTMLAGGFRHLPIREGKRVIGMVSMRDLSRAKSGLDEGPPPAATPA